MASPTTFPTGFPAADGARGTGGVRLSGISFRVFPEPSEQHVSAEHKQVAVDLLRAYGREVDASDLARWKGNSFTSMSDGLLGDLAEPLPGLDFVLLSFETPDMHVADVAGCYLAGKLPGAPVSFSVSEQAAGGPFTALRIADAMTREGDLAAGALFVYDQTAQVWEPEVRAAHDSAVLVRLGVDGDVELTSVTETVVTDPAAGLAAAMTAAPGALTVVGPALAGRIGPLAGADPQIVLAPADHACTSVWVALANLWPLTGPVLLADLHPRTNRLHSCVLTPAGST